MTQKNENPNLDEILKSLFNIEAESRRQSGLLIQLLNQAEVCQCEGKISKGHHVFNNCWTTPYGLCHSIELCSEKGNKE